MLIQNEMSEENLLALEQAVQGRVTLATVDEVSSGPDWLMRVERSEMTRAALSVLEGDELMIIRHSFALDADGLTDEQIRMRLDLSSRVKVVRMRARALSKMRSALGSTTF